MDKWVDRRAGTKVQEPRSTRQATSEPSQDAGSWRGLLYIHFFFFFLNLNYQRGRHNVNSLPFLHTEESVVAALLDDKNPKTSFSKLGFEIWPWNDFHLEQHPVKSHFLRYIDINDCSSAGSNNHCCLVNKSRWYDRQENIPKGV